MRCLFFLVLYVGYLDTYIASRDRDIARPQLPRIRQAAQLRIGLDSGRKTGEGVCYIDSKSVIPETRR